MMHIQDQFWPEPSYHRYGSSPCIPWHAIEKASPMKLAGSAPTSSNPTVLSDPFSISTGLHDPPTPEIHRESIPLSTFCKLFSGELFSSVGIFIFKTQQFFVIVPGTRLVLPLSPNPLTGLNLEPRPHSTDIPKAPGFKFAN
ncbi:hypothetical protein HanPSC8_Chr17g0778801 [Helianthus annuus]|nr:hypothetical protein HanPSC8_Chr17g0778801 [Helianthus annuus]